MTEDFQKNSSLECNCSCGQTFFIFLGETDPLEVGTVCPKCGLKGYQLWCEEHGAGYYYSEDSKNLNLQERTWKCPDGHETKPISTSALSLSLKGYLKEEIPEEVWKRIWG